MDTNYSDNNHLILVGKVTSEKKFSHEIYGEKFYIFEINKSFGNYDINYGLLETEKFNMDNGSYAYKDTLSESLSGSFGFSDLLFDYLKDLQSKQGTK